MKTQEGTDTEKGNSRNNAEHQAAGWSDTYSIKPTLQCYSDTKQHALEKDKRKKCVYESGLIIIV